MHPPGPSSQLHGSSENATRIIFIIYKREFQITGSAVWGLNFQALISDCASANLSSADYLLQDLEQVPYCL